MKSTTTTRQNSNSITGEKNTLKRKQGYFSQSYSSALVLKHKFYKPVAELIIRQGSAIAKKALNKGPLHVLLGSRPVVILSEAQYLKLVEDAHTNRTPSSDTVVNQTTAEAIFDKINLSERDSLLVLELLENPPAPNQRLLAAASALPSES